MKSKRVLALIMGAIIASGGISQMAVQVYADDEESSSISESEEESSRIPWEQAAEEFEWLDGELSDSSNSVEEGLDAEVLTKLVNFESKRVDDLVVGRSIKEDLSDLYVSGDKLVFKSISDNEAELVCYDVNDKFDGIVTVPQNVIIEDKEYTVTSIGDSAFKNYNRLENVVLPASITKIGEDAFSDCEDLQLTALPDGLTKIGKSAFCRCKKLKLTALPKGLKEIGDAAFYGCESLESIELPAGLKEIGDRTFCCCSKLQSIVLSTGLTEIGSYAFNGCISLQLIALPEGLKEIGTAAFAGCRDLQLTALPESLTEIDESAFEGCKNLNLTELPTGLTKIGRGAFENCRSLQLTALPKGLTEIGIGAFVNAHIVRITIPAGVIWLGDDAFDTVSLEEINLSDGSGLSRNDIQIACGDQKNKVRIVMPQPARVKYKRIYNPDQLVGGEGFECNCPICREPIIKEDSEEPVKVAEFPCNRGTHCHYMHLNCFKDYHHLCKEKDGKIKCSLCQKERYDVR